MSATPPVELTDVAARLREHARRDDPELEPLVEGARIRLAGARPLGSSDVTGRGLLVTLELPARALGTALASPSIQDRLASLAASAIGEEPDETLLDLSLAWLADPDAPPSHPYRSPADGPPRAAKATLEEAVGELLSAYFAARAANLRWETQIVADEVVVTIFADSMIFSSLSAPLRDALRRLATKVLLERRAP